MHLFDMEITYWEQVRDEVEDKQGPEYTSYIGVQYLEFFSVF